MWIRRTRGWEIKEALATPEGVYVNRRNLLKSAAVGGVGLAVGGWAGGAAAAEPAADPSAGLYPVPRNETFKLDRALTAETDATEWNNFYEFGSSKNIWRSAQALPIRPWQVSIDGLVEKPFQIGIDDILAKMPLEERLYRHRCVEAWSMAVPWSGFALRHLVDLAKPTSAAKYVKFTTPEDSDVMPGQRAVWYPWPYIEGVTMAEAQNDLAFIATGLYGKPIPKQNGAPLRLVLPWKYGFKSIKSIVAMTFTDERPVSFWEEIQGSEYGFWANVNPKVPHPRWSQATEEVLGTGERVPTQIYNGYGEWVASLYAGMEGERLFM